MQAQLEGVNKAIGYTRQMRIAKEALAKSESIAVPNIDRDLDNYIKAYDELKDSYQTDYNRYFNLLKGK